MQIKIILFLPSLELGAIHYIQRNLGLIKIDIYSLMIYSYSNSDEFVVNLWNLALSSVMATNHTILKGDWRIKLHHAYLSEQQFTFSRLHALNYQLESNVEGKCQFPTYGSFFLFLQLVKCGIQNAEFHSYFITVFLHSIM